MLRAWTTYWSRLMVGGREGAAAFEYAVWVSQRAEVGVLRGLLADVSRPVLLIGGSL